jgi:TRAP-type mannitol/chloroaromatic compound transport system permease large subunit
MGQKEISLSDIYRSVWPFVALMVLGLGIVMAFPGITTWLPDLVYAH